MGDGYRVGANGDLLCLHDTSNSGVRVDGEWQWQRSIQQVPHLGAGSAATVLPAINNGTLIAFSVRVGLLHNTRYLPCLV